MREFTVRIILLFFNDRDGSQAFDTDFDRLLLGHPGELCQINILKMVIRFSVR